MSWFLYNKASEYAIFFERGENMQEKKLQRIKKITWQGIIFYGFPVWSGLRLVQRVAKVLSYYPWRADIVVYIQDGVFQVMAQEGCFCLKKAGKPLERVKFSLQTMDWVQSSGMVPSAVVALTKLGEPLVYFNETDGEQIWFASVWITGKRCVFAVPDHLEQSALTLAKFHKAARNCYFVGGILQYHLWEYILEQQIKELEQYARKKISHRQRYRNRELQKVLQQQLPAYIKRGKQGLQLMQDANWKLLAEEQQKQHCIIHGDVAARNFVIEPMEHTSYLIDFDYARYDMQIIDLVRMIERAMRASHYHFPVAAKIINAYQQEKKLTQQELQVLVALLMHPQKIWRLCRRFFEKETATELLEHRLQYLLLHQKQEFDFLDRLEQGFF